VIDGPARYLAGMLATPGRISMSSNSARACARTGPAGSPVTSYRSASAVSPLPVNAMAVPGGPTVEQLAEAGVRRVSIGSTIAQAAYRLVLQATEEMLAKGTYTTLAGAGAFADIDGAFARR
jgi:2-methylisocitrate lyase-like PEP mutase family enzyme